ncbi:MAG TPA: pilin [Candidatus Saccharimonadales bacterium]
MKQLIRTTLTVVTPLLLLVVFVGVSMMLTGDTAYASNKTEAQQGVREINNGSSVDLSGFIERVVNILLFVIGAVAVVMIIIGGIRYTTSNGDSSQVSSAKSTILYAVVGLILAIASFAIVSFVLDAI